MGTTKKRLIVCCDGTWQNLDQDYPTNVGIIAQGIRIKCTPDDETQQIIYYDSGIGTGGSTYLSRIIERFFGGGLGVGIDEKIQQAYRFLCLNYELGDEIYLFGFSRGAYTVRSLAGLIYQAGILQHNRLNQVQRAYELYRSRKNIDKPNTDKMKKFRRENSRGTKKDKYDYRPAITLLCCWDTVGALGVPNLNPIFRLGKKLNKKYEFHDTTLSQIIQNAIHAVAIDETRNTFPVTLMKKSEKNDQQKLLQVWFPGDHGCVGGGSAQRAGLSNGALKWIIESIKEELKLGLEFNTDSIKELILEINKESIKKLDSDSNSLDNEEEYLKLDPAIDYQGKQSIFDNITQFLGQTQREIPSDTDISNFHYSVLQRQKKVETYRPSNVMSIELLEQLLKIYLQVSNHVLNKKLEDVFDSLVKLELDDKSKNWFMKLLNIDPDFKNLHRDERFKSLWDTMTGKTE